MTSPIGRPPVSRSPCLFRSVEGSRESPLHVHAKCVTPPQQAATSPVTSSSAVGGKGMEDRVAWPALSSGVLASASGTVTTTRQTVASSVESAQLAGPPPPPPPAARPFSCGDTQEQTCSSSRSSPLVGLLCCASRRTGNGSHTGFPSVSHIDGARLAGGSPAQSTGGGGIPVKPPRTPPKVCQKVLTHLHRSRFPAKHALAVDVEGVLALRPTREEEPAAALLMDDCDEGCALVRNLSHSSDAYSSSSSSSLSSSRCSNCASPVDDVVEQEASTRPFLSADQLFQSVVHGDTASFWSNSSPAESSAVHGRSAERRTAGASVWRPQQAAVPFVRRYRSSVQSYGQQNRMLPNASDTFLHEPGSNSGGSVAAGPRSHCPSRRRHFGFVRPTSAQSSSTPPSR